MKSVKEIMNVLNIFRQMYAGVFLKIHQKQIMLK